MKGGCSPPCVPAAGLHQVLHAVVAGVAGDERGGLEGEVVGGDAA